MNLLKRCILAFLYKIFSGNNRNNKINVMVQQNKKIGAFENSGYVDQKEVLAKKIVETITSFLIGK